MGGGGRSTHTTSHSTTENPYDDQWIRDRFAGVDQRGVEFSNFMANRQANLSREQGIRDQLQSGLAGLQADFAGAQANISNLQQQNQQSQADFAGLSGAQLQQAKDLYNLAQDAGSGVQGYKNPAGMTFIRPKGTAGLNRQSLQTQSLNV